MGREGNGGRDTLTTYSHYQVAQLLLVSVPEPKPNAK